jgi:filamentous hemagglutinin family protein
MIARRGTPAAILILGAVLAMGVPAHANPVNPTVTAGSAAFEGLGTGSLTIRQASHAAVINWQSFNIAANEVTRFIQPSNLSMALNRIGDIHPSLIFGSLQANGHVFLLNPNGILFGSTAQVNVGGLTATSLHLSDQNFLAGTYLFEGTAANGAVVNHGTIKAGPGGVYLLAPKVENGGLIESPEGQIALAGGSSVYLSDRPDGKGLLVEVKAPDGEAVNLKDLIADGGQVSMIGRVVSQQGLVQANSVREKNGKIELYASEQLHLKSGSRTTAMGAADGVSHGGTVLVVADKQRGTASFEQGAVIDVSGGQQGGNGGFAEFSGAVTAFGGTFKGGASIGWQRGKLLIDPVELVVDTNLLTSFILSGMDITALADQDIRVTAFLDLINFNVNYGGTVPDGQVGNLHLAAGQDLIFDRALIINSSSIFDGGNRWNLSGTAERDVVFRSSNLWTGAGFISPNELGGSFDFHAMRDIRFEQPSGLGRSYLWAAGSGDITLAADRDILAPSAYDSSLGLMSGIRLDNGTLTMTAGRDILGGTINGVEVGPGFSLKNGTAQVTAGGNIGSSTGYGTLTLGGGELNVNGGIVPGTLGQANVTLSAGGSVYLGLVQDGGLTQGLTGNRFVTANPLSSVDVAAASGDVHLKPAPEQTGNFVSQRTLYPATFTADATQGSIFVESNLGFWPSQTGRVELTAHDRLEGVVPTVTGPDSNFIPRLPDGRLIELFTREQLLFMGFTADDIARLSTPPIITRKGGLQNIILYAGDLNAIHGVSDSGTIDVRLQMPPASVPAHAPVPVTFSTQTGDISGVYFKAITPSYQKEVTISSGRDLKEFVVQVSAPEGVTATVSAARDIDMSRTGPEGTTSGIQFFGKGTGLVRAGGNLNLSDSGGIIHALSVTGDTSSNNPGLLRVAVDGNLDMTKTQIVTQNGGSISIHGRSLDLMTPGGQIALGNDGMPLAEQGQVIGNVLHDAQGNPVLIGGNPVILDGTQPQVARQTVQEGNALVSALTVNGASIRYSGQVANSLSLNGLVLPKLNGQAVNPVLSAAGKPIVISGKLVLENGGQIILADAGYGQVLKPVGGGINVGSNAGATGTTDRGIITRRGGAIDIWATGDVNVNTSRVSSLGGGNIAIKTVTGDISAGSGGKDEVTRLVFQDPLLDEFGNPILGPDGKPLLGPPEVFLVPGSGIFTFHRNDPIPLILDFPEFDTPAITAVKAEIVKNEFLGRNASALKAELAVLVKEREAEYIPLFDAYIDQFKLGDINLNGGRDVVIPPAGIRGRVVTINAGRNVVFAGGTVQGSIKIESGTVTGQVNVVGSLASVGGVTAAGSSASSGSALGGLSGLGGNVAAPTSASSSTSSTASGNAQQTKESTQQVTTDSTVAASQVTRKKEEKTVQLAKSVRVKKGVTIQVEAKPAKQ